MKLINCNDCWIYLYVIAFGQFKVCLHLTKFDPSVISGLFSVSEYIDTLNFFLSLCQPKRVTDPFVTKFYSLIENDIRHSIID